MPQEPRLEMLPDKDLKLSGEHFRKVVRRIESIVPLAGDGVIVTPKDGGYEISVTPGGATSSTSSLSKITISVCADGVPSTIEVYGPSES